MAEVLVVVLDLTFVLLDGLATVPIMTIEVGVAIITHDPPLRDRVPIAERAGHNPHAAQGDVDPGGATCRRSGTGCAY